jgi:hypothetical protein
MERWPCPCCGHLTLPQGPGDYELCPVCFWEDDGGQLRWPLSPDGANGISLVEAQANYQRFGAAHRDSRGQVRRARAGEPLASGWRPIDLAIDNVERAADEPDAPPWPADLTRLYWWLPTYYRSPNAAPSSTAGREPESPSERLMARVLVAVPEARPLDDRVRRMYESPAPFVFCGLLPDLVFEALESGNEALAMRVVTALNTGLTDGDPDAHNCVSIAFLEDDRWHAPELASFVERWPTELRAEIGRQISHARESDWGIDYETAFAEYHRAYEELRAAAPDLDLDLVESRFRALGSTYGLPFGDAEVELFARLIKDDRWPTRHPLQAIAWAWRHRRSATLPRRLQQLTTKSVHFAG